MAVSMYEGALLAAQRGESGRAGVMMTFARTSPLLNAIPRISIAGNAYHWKREVSLGTNATRGVNGSYTESTGQTEDRVIPLKIMGGDLDVDNFLIATGGPGVRAQKEEAKAADLAQRIAYHMIKGSTTTAGGATADAHGMDGLQVRYGGGFATTAVVDGGENAGQILLNAGGAALSMRSLDEAIQLTENPTHLLMPKKQRLNITGFLRSSSAVQMVKDEFGRIVTTYNGLPILDADVLGTVSGLEQLGYNENNNSSTSIYVLNLSDDGLALLQNDDPRVTNLGEQDTKPVWRTRVEWYCHVADMHPRCVTRLYSITDLVAVA